MGAIGRNEPCPCGSGLKYKKCCQTNQAKNSRLLWAVKNAQTAEGVSSIINREPLVHRYLVTLDAMRGVQIRRKVSRIIEILDEDTLYDLHLAIQSAFGWDNDHMFSFFLSDRIYDKESEYSGSPFGEYERPFTGDMSKPAAETRLFHLQLAVGRQIKYLFDYGDDLIHTIQLTAIEPPALGLSAYPRLIKSVGKAPEQYS